VALNLNTRIAELRKSQGLTQLDLANRIQVTETTIANWEKGRSGVEWILKVAALCKILDCQPEDLISSPEGGAALQNQPSMSLEEIQDVLGTRRALTHKQSTK
jgi:transcriptional regulator with XRE-family HTH domain